MKQITPYPLWLGHVGESREFRHLFDAGIQAVVEVAVEELPSAPPRELLYCRFPLIDSTGNERYLLDLAINTVGNLLERRVTTLVCCSNGMSRSPAVAAAALALVYQESPEEFLTQIAAQHPSDVSPGLWTEILAFLDSTRSI